MIPEFEQLAKRYPLEGCYTFVERDGRKTTVSLSGLRREALALAYALEQRGVGRGSFVVVDMGNCPAFVTTVLAAAYNGLTLVILNHRLTPEEKSERLSDLRVWQNIPLSTKLDESKVESLVSETWSRERDDRIIHYGERNAALFDASSKALVMFTSGSSGRPKAVSLSWRNLCGASQASNAVLNTTGRGLWQAALPLFHIGGLQVVIRSVLNATPFLLYRRFSPEQILSDAVSFGATHISVVDKMLFDLIAADAGRLKQYRCILLGGAAPNPVNLVQAVARGARVYASYGMTETSSQIASRLVGEDYDGSLDALPGYEMRIISPNERGVGQLAVKGPGVFERYLNAQRPSTVDGFFLTGDSASIVDGRLKVQERVSDMFVSGGENVYPAEITDKLLRMPGVTDAYVFGSEDETWGRRPVAFVEHELGHSPSYVVPEVRKNLIHHLAKIYQPRSIHVMERFPRTGVGKTDKEALRMMYGNRLDIRQVKLYRIRQQLITPFVTAKTTMRTRESILVEVVDAAGRTGIGECVSFPTDWYLPETLDHDAVMLEQVLAPMVIENDFLHPRELSTRLNTYEDIVDYPLAQGAIEPALWDLYGKVVGKPLWQLLADECGIGDISSGRASESPGNTRDGLRDSSFSVAAGMVVGIMSFENTLATVQQAVGMGYTRVKLKIKPGDDIVRVRAVREAFPQITLMLDASQSYTEADISVFQALDSLDIACIEEPLDPGDVLEGHPHHLFQRLAALQRTLRTPLCLDESIHGPADADAALSYPELRCFALKIGKWGGVAPALDFYRRACAQGAQVWMGGMYETAVSKYLHAAFEMLPGITLPGDLSSTSRYFRTEIATPSFEVRDGMIPLNRAGYSAGLGCDIDREVLSQVILEERVIGDTIDRR